MLLNKHYESNNIFEIVQCRNIFKIDIKTEAPPYVHVKLNWNTDSIGVRLNFYQQIIVL